MERADQKWAALVGHPSTGSDAIRRLDAHVQGGEGGILIFRYVLRAAMAHVRIPPEGAGDRADGLWKHTCFEAFIAVSGTPGYYELNFSPSRQWAIYGFDAYREGMSPVELAVAPEISARRFDDRLEIEAVVGLGELAVRRDSGPLRLALSAVVEEDSGTLSYWALKHAPGKPDFHHPAGFVLELAT